MRQGVLEQLMLTVHSFHDKLRVLNMIYALFGELEIVWSGGWQLEWLTKYSGARAILR